MTGRRESIKIHFYHQFSCFYECNWFRVQLLFDGSSLFEIIGHCNEISKRQNLEDSKSRMTH